MKPSRAGSTVALAALLGLGAYADFASVASAAPARHAMLEAGIPVHRLLERATRAADAVERVLPQLRAYDSAAQGSEAVRDRFYAAVLECGRAERALRAAAGKMLHEGRGEEAQPLLQAAGAYSKFATSLRELHREIVLRADPRPAIERVSEHLVSARAQLRVAATTQRSDRKPESA